MRRSRGILTAISRGVIAGAVLLAGAPARVASTPAPSPPTLTPDEWAAHSLGRAVDRWLAGDLRGAAELLETIDVSTTSTFPEADRAAFLLAAAYLQLGDPDAFEATAARAASPGGSPYRRWIHDARLLQTRTGGAQNIPAAARVLPGAGIMSAALLIERGRAKEALTVLAASRPDDELVSLHLYLRALARVALGEDPTSDWEALAGRSARRPLEADLIGAAVVELAGAALDEPARATRILERVPPRSRHAPRALHLRALLAAAAGDSTTAHSLLRGLLRDHPDYEAGRDVRLALGGMMMNHTYWHAALRYFESAADRWNDEYAALAMLEDEGQMTEVWRVWSRREDWRDEIRLSNDAALAHVARVAQEALNLARETSLEPDGDLARGLWPSDDGPATAGRDSTRVLARHAPSPEEWERVRSIEWQGMQAAAALSGAERAVDVRRRELERRARYLALGAARGAASEDTLAAAAARLDALIARLDATLLELARVRDGALAHVAVRTRELRFQIQREIVFARALRHFYVDGPQRDRPETLPPGTPGPAELLAREEALAVQAEAFLSFFAAHYGDVIRRSFDEAWRPRLVDDSRRLRGEVGAGLARARGIGSAIDSTRAALAEDPVLAAALARRDRFAAAVDSLRAAEARARLEVAGAVAERARRALEAEREAIDYHLGDASYELAVQTATDSTLAEHRDVAAALREQAIAHLERFLARHPGSAARGESRYRLADLHLLKARDEFRAGMASFLDDSNSGRTPPLVDYGPAVAAYRAILREDPDFPHQDAVLFNLGMILADDGQPDAMTFLSRLVTEYPASPDVQEAWLRMGNDRFDHRDFAGAAPFFEHAVPGRNPSFTAMALYKLGWSHFEEDRFEEASDAFARLIDHHDAYPALARSMDLRNEAEEYLVHSLARSGGAGAFQRHFDRAGPRAYEARVLASLAQLLRGASLYAEAAECERVWLTRYPTDPGALAVVERLVDTYRRWNRPEEARAVRRAEAERFFAGGAWYRAQRDASVRSAADAFARGAIRESAAHRHARARKTGDAADWRRALAEYETYIAHWPGADDSPRLHYLASETAAKVEDYPRALRHLSAAITCDSLPLVAEASWQRVAVADAWYRRSQAVSPEAGGLGPDSLATRVLTVGDEFTSRLGSDPRAADVAWRQGNLALAHGWYADAATRLARFGERHPGDRRAVAAITRSGDARYRLSEYEAAGATYEKALALARTAGRDSVVVALQTTIPTCYYQHAERVARSDSTRGEEEAAPLFARVAREWPRFAHADLALYRAGLGYAARGSHAEAIAAWEELLRLHPASEYARDSAIQVATTREKAGDREGAAGAYDRFATRFPADPDAATALLKSAELLAAAGRTADAERARSRFLDAYPHETAAVMEIRAERAEKELAAVASRSASISSLLAEPATSELKAYLALAEMHPDLASAPLLARCDYLRAGEAHAAYATIRLTQPLPPAIEKKQAALEKVLAAYDRCAQRNVTEYARAAAHRIGDALIEFGDALLASERPQELTGDDLLAYEDVLAEQSWGFYDRGEDVWSELLRQARHDQDDPGGWVQRTQERLWPRLAQRFQFQPEVRYPLVAGAPPAPAPAP